MSQTPSSPTADTLDAEQARAVLDALRRYRAGDFTAPLPDAAGIAGEIAAEYRALVEQSSTFAVELTRVSRETGPTGKLGAQMMVSDAEGVWKDLTANVNLMAEWVTVQARTMAMVVTARDRGDRSVRITLTAAQGEWAELNESVNALIADPNVGQKGGAAGPLRAALERLSVGDLSVRLPEDSSEGVDAATAAAFNRHAAMLSVFAAELSGVMQSLGTDCRYGAQMAVPDAGGEFAAMVKAVNRMSADLTDQFRAVALAVTAVANGDLSRLITLSAPGEMGEFIRTVNTMVHQLNGFAGELTRLSREIGSVGRFGGQMETPGMTGSWRDLTDNVNLMAANLTNQVRDLSQTARAAVENRSPRPTSFPAQGEMLHLFDYVDALATKQKV